MKKIFLSLAMLLGLFISPSAFAQDAWDVGFSVDFEAISRDGYRIDWNSPLILDVWEQLYGEEGELNPCCDPGEGSEWALLGESKPDEVYNRNSQDFWHSNWHNGNQPAGSHYLQVMMTDDLNPDDLIMFAFKRRSADNDHTTVWMVMGTDDPEATKDECEEIAWIETPFSSNTETLLSTPFKRGEYQYLRFYSEEQSGRSYGSRGYFHMSRFNIFPAVKMSDNDKAWAELDRVYNEYNRYLDNYWDRMGTDPGDYDEETVQAFYDAMDAVGELDSSSSAEEIFALAERIQTTYAAIEPTKVPFTAKNLPSGYYRIKGGMWYYNDGEDVEKYMMGYRSDGKLWGIWATPDFDELQDNIQALWKITPVTETTFDVVNMYHDGRFLPVERSIAVEMSKESDYLLTFDAVATNHDYEISYVNIRLADQEADGYVYLHQNGHQNGMGIDGYLVGWSNTWSPYSPGASEWYFEPVDASEAEAIIAAYDKGEDEWRENYKVMMQEIPGMIAVAKDVQKLVDEEKPAVSDANPITSPCSDSAEGQHIEYLWDGRTDNFWHSDWHGEFTNEDHHYFQVELPNLKDYASAVFTFTRRNTTSGNQIYKWNVVGFDDDDFELVQEDGELLAEIVTPYHAGNNTESYISDVFETKRYRYIRFYCMGTKYNDGSESGNSKFMHLAEFQLYPGRVYQSPTCQYVLMGDIASNLEAIYNELEDVEAEDVNASDYGRLKAAYDAFIANYVDPQELRETMAQAERMLEQVVEGTDPGFYPVGSSAALINTLAAAKAYDEAGAYTRAQSDDFLASLWEQMETLDASPIQVKEGKWYRIRFGTEEEYVKYNWTSEGNDPRYYIQYGDTLAITDEGLFGKYIAVSQLINEFYDEDYDGNDINVHVIQPIAKDEVALGQTLHGIDRNQLKDQDMALFRFVKVGDGYAIQNKATGLFISNAGSLSIQPGIFTQHPSGYGQNAFFNQSLEGTTYSPLHLAQNQTVLCAWGDEDGAGWTDADGRRGSFFVEEVTDVLPSYSYSFGDFKMKVTPGDIYSLCYPVPITVKNSEQGTAWTVNNVERSIVDNFEQVKVNLAQITDAVIPAGQPFFYIAAGDYPEEWEEYDPVLADFSFKFDLVTAPQNDGFLKGSFEDLYMYERYISAGYGHDEDALRFFESRTTVAANHAYISGSELNGEPFARRAELEITFGGEVVSGLLGDANLDGSVDVVDVTTTVDFILGKAQPNAKQRTNTDVNKDNSIDVVDLTSIVSIILGNYKPAAAPAKAPARIQTNDVLLVDGSDLALQNEREYVAFQMDVTLTDGAALNSVQLSERAAGKNVTFRKMAGNTYRVLAYSLDNTPFTGNEGTLLTLGITGNQQAIVSNVLFSDGTKAYTLGTQVATGISDLATDSKQAVYDLNGRRVSNLKTGGVYITNGKTKVVK